MNTLIISFVLILSEAIAYPYNYYDILFNPLDMRTFRMPASCRSKGMEFCFDNEDYPIEIVQDLLKDLPNLEVAKSDVVDRLEYSDRLGEPDENDCRTQSSIDPIYYIVDEFGRDRIVLQLKGVFEQQFSVMWCDKEGRLTSNTQHFLMTNFVDFELYCENKYANYDFLVLSLRPNFLGQWAIERAKTKTGIPVCCACKYKKVDY